VLHIVSSSLPFKGAGYNVRTAAVAACQRAVGLDPHVAVRTGYGSAVHRGGSARRMIEGTPVTWLEAPPGTGHPHDRLQAVSARSAAALAAELRPSVLHAASDYLQAQLALALREPVGVPVVYEARGFWEETWASGRPEGEAAAMTSERYLLSRAAETAAMLAADAVVTLSDVMREEIVARGCPADRVVVVPNAVDADRFPVARRDTALGASLGIGPDDPVVGYVSTLNGYEGIGYLLEAAALLRSRVPGLRVLVVGDGPDEPAIRATASRLGLDDGTLVMPGRVGHDVIPRYYSLIDVFVVPRTADRVARLVTPLKPYEAMALGKAVVVSDLPALREVVAPGETGLTFRAEDPADLAEVVGGLLDDPVLRRRLGEQARAWVLTERTWAANGRRYRDLYERLGVALA
jgi:glycosyltransferase involved in cell wall biosynthesis